MFEAKKVRSNLAEELECWMPFFAAVSDIVGRKELSGREFGGFIYGRIPMRLHFQKAVNAIGIHC